MMCRLCAFVLLTLWCIVHCVAGHDDLDDPIVETKLGTIRGSVMFTQSNRPFLAFRGIRYAKPPIDDLRFNAPEPTEAWTEVFNAQADGPSCPQPNIPAQELSEDCLRLNVYSPNVTVAHKHAVLVYIHGGGLYAGSGASRQNGGPEYLMDRDLVLVTINYRLGPLGFLSLGTRKCPGNAGFKDQVLALRWIRDHIGVFGGDAQRVTILGNNAGALSAALLMVSPMSKGLFHGVIAMSPTLLGLINLPSHQFLFAQRQAGLVECRSKDPDELLACLSEISAEEISKHLFSMFEFGRSNPLIMWMPVIEPDFGQERFLDSDPHTAFREGNFMRVPVMTGVTQDELTNSAVEIIAQESLLNRFNEEFERVAPICLIYERDTEFSFNLSKALKEHYFKGNITADSLIPLANMFSDALIRFPTQRFIEQLKNYTAVFNYVISFKGRVSHLYHPGSEPYGVEHTDDLLYLFVIPKVTEMFTPDDPEYEMVEKLTSIWEAFVKNGKPYNPDIEFMKDLNWPPVAIDHDYYLDIGENLTLRETGGSSNSSSSSSDNNSTFLPVAGKYEIWKLYFP